MTTHRHTSHFLRLSGDQSSPRNGRPRRSRLAPKHLLDAAVTLEMLRDVIPWRTALTRELNDGKTTRCPAAFSSSKPQCAKNPGETRAGGRALSPFQAVARISTLARLGRRSMPRRGFPYRGRCSAHSASRAHGPKSHLRRHKSPPYAPVRGWDDTENLEDHAENRGVRYDGCKPCEADHEVSTDVARFSYCCALFGQLWFRIWDSVHTLIPLRRKQRVHPKNYTRNAVIDNSNRRYLHPTRQHSGGGGPKVRHSSGRVLNGIRHACQKSVPLVERS